MATVLPAGVSEGDVEKAIEAFVDVLGADAVMTDTEALREFRDPYAYKQSDEWDASAAVSPTTTEQVQAIVRIANEHGIPLWTIGQGRNNTYGGAAPRVRGSVIVNMREMNQVLEVNEELCYAVVEPGVRWFDLHDALEAAGGQLLAVDPRPGLGQRRRQHPGVRARLHPVRRPRHERLRHGGRAARRRGAAHRHGRPDRQRGLARLPALLRPVARPPVHAEQLRDRHPDGRLDHAPPGGLRRLRRDLGGRGGARGDGRRAAHPHARGDHPQLPHHGPRDRRRHGRQAAHRLRRIPRGGCASRSTGARRSSTRTGRSRRRRSARSPASR